MSRVHTSARRAAESILQRDVAFLPIAQRNNCLEMRFDVFCAAEIQVLYGSGLPDTGSQHLTHVMVKIEAKSRTNLSGRIA